jgi:hypothetical protein
MERLNEYLEQRDGKLVNVKELPNCQELAFFFVTGS